MTECPVCGSEILYDVTTLNQAQREYLCGAGHRVVDIVFHGVLPMALVPYGPAVPTPEDILKSAGLSVLGS